MKDGYGAPYVKVFTSSGTEITSNIVDFVYTYSQEADDKCQIRVQDSDVNLPDRPEFQEGVILKVIWGYIGSDISKTRKVKIENIIPNFSETLICLDILCTDLASTTKKNSSKKVHQGTIVDIAKGIAESHGLKYVGISEDGKSIDVLDQVGDTHPTYFNNTGDFTIAKDNTAVPRDIKLRLFDQLPQAGKSDYQVLKEAAENEPSGLMEVYGRDNTLVVQKKNLNQKPIRVYTYAGGDGLLLEFHPEVKNLSREAAATNIETIGFSPEEKMAFGINANDSTNQETKLGDMVNESPRGLVPEDLENLDLTDSESGILKPLNDFIDAVFIDPFTGFFGYTEEQRIRGQKYNNWFGQNDDPKEVPENANQPVAGNFEPPPADRFLNEKAIETNYGYVKFGVYDPSAPGFYDNGSYTVAVDNTAVVMPFGQITNSITGVDINKTVPTVEHSIPEAYAKAANIQKENSLNKITAEGEIVGDPELESGKIMAILNISKKFSGNYYIDECSHRVIPGAAYTMKVTCSKNALGSTQMDTPNKVKTTTLKNSINKTLISDKSEGKTTEKVLPVIDSTRPIVRAEQFKGTGGI